MGTENELGQMANYKQIAALLGPNVLISERNAAKAIKSVLGIHVSSHKALDVIRTFNFISFRDLKFLHYRCLHRLEFTV